VGRIRVRVAGARRPRAAILGGELVRRVRDPPRPEGAATTTATTATTAAAAAAAATAAAARRTLLGGRRGGFAVTAAHKRQSIRTNFFILVFLLRFPPCPLGVRVYEESGRRRGGSGRGRRAES
jgi:hypothetical protein